MWLVCSLIRPVKKKSETALCQNIKFDRGQPQRVKYCFLLPVNVGLKHPDQVVETSSLSSVEPPDVWYKLAIPESVIDSGFLSALQLEAITYACQRHSTVLPSGERAGYLIGQYGERLHSEQVLWKSCKITKNETKSKWKQTDEQKNLNNFCFQIFENSHNVWHTWRL